MRRALAALLLGVALMGCSPADNGDSEISWIRYERVTVDGREAICFISSNTLDCEWMDGS